jgi:hypothetical protein
MKNTSWMSCYRIRRPMRSWGSIPASSRPKSFICISSRGLSFDDLAGMFDTTAADIRKHYNTSKERLLKALRLLDHREDLARKAENVIKKGEERTGSIPRMQRQFLLNKVFGLTPGEIGKLEGVATSTVMGNIQEYCRQDEVRRD